MMHSFRVQTVSRAPKREAEKIRRKFSKISADFKAYALDITLNDPSHERFPGLDYLPDKLDLYQTHHILPVSLRGDNSFDNLVLVDPELHKWIHAHIHRECRDLGPRSKRQIRLPYKPDLIWAP